MLVAADHDFKMDADQHRQRRKRGQQLRRRRPGPQPDEHADGEHDRPEEQAARLVDLKLVQRNAERCPYQEAPRPQLPHAAPREGDEMPQVVRRFARGRQARLHIPRHERLALRHIYPDANHQRQNQSGDQMRGNLHPDLRVQRTPHEEQREVEPKQSPCADGHNRQKHKDMRDSPRQRPPFLLMAEPKPCAPRREQEERLQDLRLRMTA